MVVDEWGWKLFRPAKILSQLTPQSFMAPQAYFSTKWGNFLLQKYWRESWDTACNTINQFDVFHVVQLSGAASEQGKLPRAWAICLLVIVLFPRSKK